MRPTKIAASIAAVGLLGAVGVATPGSAGPEFRNKYNSTSVSDDCGSDSTVTYDGPLKLWPPNHKFQPVSVTVTDESGDHVSLNTHIDVLDVAGGDGGPNHDPDADPIDAMSDADGSTTNTHQLRSERSGKGEGRTYTISYEATADNGATSCAGSFDVVVPHDMSGGADWKA